jgi:hypothetical protein
MSEPNLDHLQPGFRAAALLSDNERVIRVRSERWIDHPMAREILDELQEIVDEPPRGRMLNALLTAEPGMGKTMTLKKLVRENTRRFDPKTGLEPETVLHVLMPELPTEEAFFGQVFTALGAPMTTRNTASHRRDTALRLLRECGTRALVIDEINSLLAGSPRQQRVFLQLLRFLSNELGIALICAGTPEARQAMLTDPQLRSRFLHLELPPWRDDGDLRVFLSRLVQSLPLRRPSADRLAGVASRDRYAILRPDLDDLQSVRTRGSGGNCVQRRAVGSIQPREPNRLAWPRRPWRPTDRLCQTGARPTIGTCVTR